MFCEKCGGELTKKKKRLVCPKCGAQFSLDYNICYFEGNRNVNTAESVPISKFSFKGNVLVIVIAAVLALGIGGTTIGLGISSMPANRVSRYMGTAERYLSEMNYEQAIIEFQKILEIEPMNVDAYIGMAKAYIGLGDIDSAIAILQKGLELTEDERIRSMLESLLKEQSAVKLVFTESEAGVVYIDFDHYIRRDGELWRPCDKNGRFISDKKYKSIENFCGTAKDNYSVAGFDDGRVVAIDKNYNELFEIENPDNYAISNQKEPLILSWHIHEYGNDNDKDRLEIYSPNGRKLYTWKQDECVDGCGKAASVDDPMLPEEAKRYECGEKYHNNLWCETITTSIQEYDTISITDSKVYVSFQYELEFDWDHSEEEAARKAAYEQAMQNGGVFSWGYGTYAHIKNVYITYNVSLENGVLKLEKNNLLSDCGTYYTLGNSVMTDNGDSVLVNNLNPTPNAYFSLLSEKSRKAFTSRSDYSNDYELTNVNFNYVNRFINENLMVCGKYFDEARETSKLAVFRINWINDTDSNSDEETTRESILNDGHEQISDFYDSISYTDNDLEIGYALVSKVGKWGYISLETGEELVMFDDASNFSSGYAVVTENGMGHVINSDFKAVSEEFPCESASTLGDNAFVV